MENYYFAAVMIVVGSIALGPALLEIRKWISTRVARKDSR